MILSECLLKNKYDLGVGSANLGKSQGCFLCRYKIFLAYSDETGWKIVRLNLIQLFFRRCFGAYKSTHFEYIVSRLNDIRVDAATQSCQSRIRQIWNKKHLVWLGNVPPSEAQVICFAEAHGDKSFRTGISELINAGYKEGDIVLLEGLKAGAIDSGPYRHQQAEYLKRECVTQGWEPENFEELVEVAHKTAFAWKAKMKTCMEDLVRDLRTKGEFTAEELEALKVKLKKFGEEVKILNTYYQSKSELVLNIDDNIDDLFKKVAAGTLSTVGDHGQLLKVILLCALAKLEENQEDANYTNAKLTPEEISTLMSGVGPRNASLVSEIDKNRRLGKKVYVIAGASHLLNYPSPYVECTIVKEMLHKEKFVIITKMSMYSESIAKLNQDYTRIPAQAF